MLTAHEHGRPVASRIKGRGAIVRSLRGLVIRVGRFAQYRARTAPERVWAHALLDQLEVALRQSVTDHPAVRAGSMLSIVGLP